MHGEKMNEKKIPSAPVFPPSVRIKENFCLFHKGDIEGEIYTCPSCKTQYCLECAKKVKQARRACIKCKQMIII